MIHWEHTDPQFLTDAELRAEYCASEAEEDDDRQDALAAELERRGIDL